MAGGMTRRRKKMMMETARCPDGKERSENTDQLARERARIMSSKKGRDEPRGVSVHRPVRSLTERFQASLCEGGAVMLR